MSDHVDKAFDESSKAVDKASNKASSYGRRANDNVGKFFQSPEERKKVWSEAKRYPLAYSFLLYQLLISFIPLSASTGFVLFATSCAAATTVVAFFLALTLSLSLLLPVLLFTVPLAALLWTATVGTLAALDWLYRNIYVDSAVQARLEQVAKDVGNEYTEIERNAMKEMDAYKGQAIEGGQYVQQRGEEFYDSAARTAQQVKEDAQTQVGRAADGINGYLEEGKARAEDLERDVKQFGKDAKGHANGVGKKAKELGQETQKAGKGVANDAQKDFSH